MSIEEQYDKIFRYCYYKVHDRHLAEDLTQETFLRAQKSRQQIDVSERYLYTIARNLCIDEFRRKKAEAVEEETLEETLPQEGFEASLLEKIALEQALSKLSEEERELLILRYVNDEPFATICELTGISRFAVHRRLGSAKKKLETILERREEHV